MARLLTSPQCFATTLLVWFVDRFCFDTDDNPLRWHPETIRMEVEQELHRRLPPDNFDKLMAAIALRTDNAFYRKEADFVMLANALCGEGFDPGVWNPAEVDECCWAITEALLLAPQDGEPFADEIRHYVAFALQEEGFATAPDVLGIALGADILEQLRYDFADDPAMFEAIYGAQQKKTEEVEALVAENLRDLVQQLRLLPLENGTTEQLVAAAAAMQRRLERADSL